MFNPQYKYTLAEFWRLIEAFPEHKYEYIDGDIRMMTGGSPAHAQVIANVSYLLVGALASQECNVYSADAAVLLNAKRYYYPDVVVSCDPADWTRKKALEAPSVIVEVISPSTEKTDRIEKLDAYKRYPTIQEILLVDSRYRRIIHYQRTNLNEWQERFYQNDEDVIDLPCIGASFTAHQIYLKVYLELEEEAD